MHKKRSLACVISMRALCVTGHVWGISAVGVWVLSVTGHQLCVDIKVTGITYTTV